jgi:hypothetical protein
MWPVLPKSVVDFLIREILIGLKGRAAKEAEVMNQCLIQTGNYQYYCHISPCSASSVRGQNNLDIIGISVRIFPDNHIRTAVSVLGTISFGAN